MLAIKFDSVGASDDLGSVTQCDRCERPEGKREVGPAIFVAGTWRPVCENCARQEDAPLYAQLWRIRAELDRGVIGPETETWLASIEDRGADLVREDVERYIAR